MIFEEFATEGCRSYLVGCEEDRVAAIVDPILDRAERYAATCASRGLAIQYLIDTHTHADHFSATRSSSQPTRYERQPSVANSSKITALF